MSVPPSLPSSLSISGIYFDGRSSRDRAATLLAMGEQVTLKVQADGNAAQLEERWNLSQLQIEPPLSRVRRVIKLPGGGRFETQDDAAVSALEAVTGRNRGLSRVRRIESSWPLTLGALVTLAVFVWGFLNFGLPMLARNAARVTPPAVLESFDREAVRVLDTESFLGKSKLSAARQAEIQQQFLKVKRWASGAYPYRLLLRDGEPQGSPFTIGANAFALPNGTIVMTDQLVALSSDDRELMGVLAHETGHVTHRHALSGVYQGLGLSLLTMAVTGDVVSAGTFAAALPTFLIQKGYSRQAETDSDDVAAAFMLKEYGTTKPLRDILARLEKDDVKATEKDVQEGGKVEDMLQTHPGTHQRIEHLKALETAAKVP